MNGGIVLAALLASMAACTAKSDDAEAQYNIVSKHGTLGELCAKARSVRDAYLAQHDTINYQRWQSTAAGDCLRAEMHGGEEPADAELREKTENEAAAIIANGESEAANIMDRAEADARGKDAKH